MLCIIINHISKFKFFLDTVEDLILQVFAKLTTEETYTYEWVNSKTATDLEDALNEKKNVIIAELNASYNIFSRIIS